MVTQQLLKIVYALDIKFWVRWCTCSMWRMLLPCCKLIGLLLFCLLFLITPHAQRERGKVIGLGVLVYIYMFVVKKKI